MAGENQQFPYPTTGVERLRKALVDIRDHGETHDQPCYALHRGDCADAMQEIARAALAAVNSGQGDTAVSTDRDENVNSDRSATPIGPERGRLIEVLAQLRDELALIATRQTPTSDYEGFGEFEDQLTGWADGWARSLTSAGSTEESR